METKWNISHKGYKNPHSASTLDARGEWKPSCANFPPDPSCSRLAGLAPEGKLQLEPFGAQLEILTAREVRKKKDRERHSRALLTFPIYVKMEGIWKFCEKYFVFRPCVVQTYTGTIMFRVKLSCSKRLLELFFTSPSLLHGTSPRGSSHRVVL